MPRRDPRKTRMDIVVVGAGFAGACAALDAARAATTRPSRSSSSETWPAACCGRSRRRRACRTSTARGWSASFAGRLMSFPSCGDSSTFTSVEVYQGTRLRPDYRGDPVPGRPREPPAASVRRPDPAASCTAIQEAGEPPARGRPREYLESSVGPTLTELAFEGFNRKFWGRRLEDMPADWGKLRRLERIAETGDFRLPSTAPHYYPAGGFNPLFDQMLDGFDVRTGTRVERIERDHRGSTIVVTDEESSTPTS